MKTTTQFLAGLLITMLFMTPAVSQEKQLEKRDHRSGAIWDLFEVDREYPKRNFKTISEAEALRFARDADAANRTNANERLIRSLKRKFPDTPMQGIYLPDLNIEQCARTPDMVFITPRRLEGFPDPLDGAGGVVVGSFCSQDEELCENCSGCEGTDPDTGTYNTCICTQSAKVCRPCPSC